MRIVVLDGHTLNPGDNPWDPIARFGDLTVFDRTPSSLVVERARDAEIVLTNKTPLDAPTIGALPSLRLIAVLATGYDVVDVAAARERGVAVANVPEYGTESVAQHSFALLLELTNRLVEAYQFAWINEDLGLWSIRGKPLPYPLSPYLTAAGLRAAVRNTQGMLNWGFACAARLAANAASSKRPAKKCAYAIAT